MKVNKSQKKIKTYLTLVLRITIEQIFFISRLGSPVCNNRFVCETCHYVASSVYELMSHKRESPRCNK